MAENAQSILNRIHQYINSANFQGDDSDRFAGNSAINHISEAGLGQLSGMSEDDILSHVSRTSTQVEQEPRYSTLGGSVSMALGAPSAIVETGLRMKEKGIKQGFKEGMETVTGSRPSKLGGEAQMLLDVAAPFGIAKSIRGARGGVGKIINMPRKARVSHIGKTKTRFKSEKLSAIGREKGVATSSVRQENLQSAYNKMVNAPKQWGVIKKKARDVMNKVESSGASNIRRMIDKIVERGGSANIQSTRIDKMIFEQYNKGAINNVEARAFNVYAADMMGKMKTSGQTTQDIIEGIGKKKEKLRVGKGVKKKIKTKVKTKVIPIKKKAKDTTPRIKPSSSPIPEQSMASDVDKMTSGILKKQIDNKIKEFKARSEANFANIAKEGKKSTKKELAEEAIKIVAPQPPTI